MRVHAGLLCAAAAGSSELRVHDDPPAGANECFDACYEGTGLSSAQKLAGLSGACTRFLAGHPEGDITETVERCDTCTNDAQHMYWEDRCDGIGSATAGNSTDEAIVLDVANQVKGLVDQTSALQQGSEEIRQNVNNLQAQTTVDITINDHIKNQYDNTRHNLNSINQQLSLEAAPGFDGTAASLNEAQADVARTKEETDQMKANIIAFQQNVQAVKDNINEHIMREEKVCSSLNIWTKHAEPIMEIQDTTIKEVDAWVDHVEGEANKIASMLGRLSERLTGVEVNVLEQVEEEEMAEAESGGPGDAADHVKAD